MKIIKTSSLTAAQKETIRYLWNREYPAQLAVTPGDFEAFLAASTDHFHLLVLDDTGEVAGWATTFTRQGERWFSIIINELYQRIGLGRTLIQLLKERETQLNGWVIDHESYVKQNGEPYASPLAFYQQAGFQVVSGSRYEDSTLSAIRVVWRKAL